MSAADRPAPIRTCIGCRTRRPQRELVRLTLVGGRVEVDGASSGRGAWLCRAVDDTAAARVAEGCLQRALAKRALARAWRVEVPAAVDAALRSVASEVAPRDGGSGS